MKENPRYKGYQPFYMSCTLPVHYMALEAHW